VQFVVTLRDADKGAGSGTEYRSLDEFALKTMRTFEEVWGRYFVIELPAGRHALDGWYVEQNTGVEWNTVKPKGPVRPLVFEVSAGSVTYLGNVHGRLLWSKNVFGMDLMSGAMPEVRNEENRDLPVIFMEFPQLQGRVVVTPVTQGPWMPE